MAATFQLRPEPAGFKPPPSTAQQTGLTAIESKMPTSGGLNVASSHGQQVLWTMAMGACKSIATYTPSLQRERTLTHLKPGNEVSDEFLNLIKPKLKSDSIIIFIAGNDETNKDRFTTVHFKTFREEFDKKLQAKGVTSPPPLANYLPFWSDKGKSTMVRTGFVFKPDGRYGTLNLEGLA